MLYTQRFSRCRMGYWCCGARMQFSIRVAVLLMFVFIFSANIARAEGSTSLTQGNGYRPFLEGGYARSIVGIDRLNAFYVYAQPGEKINLGSSALGVSRGDILFKRPDGTESSCQAEFPGRGRIHSLDEEQRGALSPGGYQPCALLVDEQTAGLWQVTFIGPDPDSWKASAPVPVMQPWVQADDVYTIAAWDIAVEGVDGSSKEGRFFAEHVPVSMGDGQSALFLDLFLVTGDGYTYEIGIEGIQSHTLTLFSNRDGFLNADEQMPLYQSIPLDWSNAANKSLPAGITIDGPTGAFSSDGTIHKLFFSPPSSDLPNTLDTFWGSIQFSPEPLAPATPHSFEFSGTSGSSGTFSFQADDSGRYRIEIDINDNGVWGDGNDVVLHTDAETGMSFVLWDGMDGNGDLVNPKEGGYSARIMGVAGEIHLPFLDIEENVYGIKVGRLNGPEISRTSIYYDDARLVGDAQINEIHRKRQGTDSESGGHPILDNFGNSRGIDTWAYVTSEPRLMEETFFELQTDLRLSISTLDETAALGESFDLQLTLRNDGPSATSDARVAVDLPRYFTVVGSTSSAGSFDPGAFIWLVESLPAFNEANLTLSLISNERGTFDVYTEVVDFQGHDVDSAPNNWDLLVSPEPVEDDEDRIQIIIDPDPSIGIAKGVVEQDGDASEFRVQLEIVIENIGNTPLENVQVIDQLPEAFHGTDYSLSNLSISGPLKLNPSFDGKTAITLLAEDSGALGVGDKAIVSYTVDVVPFTTLGPYLSIAEASAIGPDNMSVSDISNDGSFVDPNGNGKASDPGEDSPTQIIIEQRPGIGVALEILSVSGRASSFSAQCNVHVENLGDVRLENMLIELDLEKVFGQNRYDVSNIQVDAPLEINADFDGDSNINLINPGQLGVSDKAVISFQLNAYPVVPEDEYSIQAIGRAQSITGHPVSDFSDSGSDPDSNKNRLSSDLGEGDPTTIAFDGNPVIGASLFAERVTGDLSGFTGYYTLDIKNLGDVPLYGIQAFNDLEKVYPQSDYEVLDVSSIYGIEANDAFNGRDVKNLVGAQDIPLYPGETFRVEYVVEVQPKAYFGPFNTSVLVKAQSEQGVITTDLSDSGVEIDADNDGNPDEADENDFHELRFATNAAVGAALAMNTVSGDLQQFNVSYSIFVENKSDVPLHNLSLRHVLDSTFTGAQVEILNLSTESDLVFNPHFDGVSQTELLKEGSSSLEIGESASVVLEVQVNPTQNFGPYFVGVVAEGETPLGNVVSDYSNEGTVSDPNGNGNPSEAGENNPAILSILEKPVIGATFDAVDINGDMTEFRARHVVRLENLGDVPLEQVQAEFDVQGLYTGADVEVIRLAARGPLSINESYDGVEQIQLLSGVGAIDIADTVRVEIDVLVKPGEYTGSFVGNVGVSARGPAGTMAIDTSDKGGIIDSNNNGLANEKGENRPTEISPDMNPSVGIAKMVTRINELDDGTFELQYSYLVQNLGDVRLSELRIIEDLKGVFGDNAVYVTGSRVLEDQALVLNPAFNGASDTNLLDQERSLLNPGEQATVILDLKTTTSLVLREVASNSIVRGLDPAGNEVEDISNDGVHVDPNGNGLAGELNENNPTHVLFESQDNVEFGSWLTNVMGNDSKYTATLKASISNLGLRDLKGVQLILDLVGEMTEQDVQVKNVTLSDNATVALNDAFDGIASTEIFADTDNTLQKGTAIHVWVDVEVTPGNFSAPKQISFQFDAENGEGQIETQMGNALPIFRVTSTGEDAGLESNGDLASLLAERSYRRQRGIGPINVSRASYPLHMVGVDGVHGKGSLKARENLELVPAKGPNNSDAIVKTPEDLYGVTNATSILAIDYMENDHRTAGLFATTTTAGETYEHSKNICDRLQGGDLKNVEIVSIRGYPFVRSTLVHASGEVDYAISFISYKQDISHLIDSRFVGDDYVVDRISSGEILNFQVWSYNPAFTEEIVEGIIERMEETGHVDFFSREDDIPEVPSTFVTSSRYEQGVLFFLMKHEPGVTEYRFTGETSLVEGGEKQMFEEVVTVPLAFQTNEYVPIEVKSGALFDALLYVGNDLNEDVDHVYLSDGAWGRVIEDHENVEIDLFDILSQDDAEVDEGRFLVERGVHFKGTIKEDVVLFRHFKPGGTAIDLSEYDYIAFNASGKGDVHIQLESELQGEPVVQKIVSLSPESKLHSIRLSEFISQLNPDTGFEGSQVTTLSFMFQAHGDEGVDVELRVEDIFFGKGQPVSGEEETPVPLEFSLAQNYPNPFSNTTTLEFEVPEPAHIQITIYDLLGRKVMEAVNKEFAIGKHNVQLDAGQLASGMYLYKMDANDQVFIQTMHIVR